MVVFPEPDGPMMETFSPGITSKLRVLRTSLSPHDLLTFSNVIIGFVAAAAVAAAAAVVGTGVLFGASASGGKASLQGPEEV